MADNYFIRHSQIWGLFKDGLVSMTKREEELEPMRDGLDAKMRPRRRWTKKTKDRSMRKSDMRDLQSLVESHIRMHGVKR